MRAAQKVRLSAKVLLGKQDLLESHCSQRVSAAT
jgi:hypothetical protein